MATSLFVPVEEYLSTVYRPDCEYVDGVIEERNLGEYNHGRIQSRIATAFGARNKVTRLEAITEWRFRLSPTRYRVPDVIVIREGSQERVLTQPPLLCIEILSPEDRAGRVNAHIREYLDFGVPAVWLIDPEAKTLIIYRKDSFEPVSGLKVRVDGTDVEIPMAEIFE